MSATIVSVDELCAALEDVLTTHLPAQMIALGYTPDAGYEPVKAWQQTPTLTALSEARLPAGAISTPGMVTPPKRSPSHQAYETTWRLVAGVYVRGRDHDETQKRARDYAAAIRTTVLAHKGLGGRARSLRWYGEEHAILPGRESARTLAAAAVAFDVGALVFATGKPLDLPQVTQTPTVLSVQ